MGSSTVNKKAACRDAEATKNSILDAAEEEFARAGPSGRQNRGYRRQHRRHESDDLLLFQ